MARMSGAPATVNTPPELARVHADPENSNVDCTLTQDEQVEQTDQAEIDAEELPSFRPLTGAAFWRPAQQAPAVDGSPARDSPAASRHHAPHVDRKVVESTTATWMGGSDNPTVASRSSRHSGRFRFALLAGLFAGGVAAGIGGAYVADNLGPVGGSFTQYARTTLSFITAGVRSREAQTHDGTDRGYAISSTAIGSNAAGYQPTSEGRSALGTIEKKSSDDRAGKSLNPSGLSGHGDSPPRRGPGQLSGVDIPNGNGSLAALVQQAERQMANRQLERPNGDNALETYRRLVAMSPDHPATTFVGERLSTAFWSLAMDAKSAEHWDEAVRYLNILDSLPPVSAAAILSGVERTPTSAAQGGKRQTMEPPELAKTGSPPKSKEMPTQAVLGPAREINRVPDSLQATTTELPSTKDGSQAIASLVIARGDNAMRLGDVAAARRFYQLAASAGIAGAAGAVARTYDPIYLQKAGVRGLQADIATAMRWYEKAAAEGDTEARTRLKQLLDAAQGARR